MGELELKSFLEKARS